jgi:hypothetical protein
MSAAPVLTPAEQIEVDRFGLHDEERLGDIAENFDDELMCHKVDAVAAARIINICCGNVYLICSRHLDAVREMVESCRSMQCITCHRKVTTPVFDEIYRVVPL